MPRDSTKYGENPDGSLKEGVIFLDPTDGEVKSVQPGEKIWYLHGDPFTDEPIPDRVIKA